MTRKQRRLILIGGGLSVLAIAVALMLNAFRNSIVFFNSPSDVVEKHVEPGTRIRLGGLVKDGSVVRGNNLSVRFEVTDGKTEIPVTYSGVLPDLFYLGHFMGEAESPSISRRVLSWRLSITMEAAFCVATLEDALARHGKPDIFNTDQGSQFTSEAFTGVLAGNDIAISMDGKGAWRDNVFVERLWRTVKYEEVYLKAYDSVSEARSSIGRYLDFYNGRRPHSSLDGATPDQAYFPPLPIRLAA